MKGALIILAVLILIGIILYIDELRRRKHIVHDSDSAANEEMKSEVSKEGSEEQAEGCCGLHLVCEKDSLSPMSAEIEYYDDEELDRFIGRPGNDYTPEETEEFRDVLMTLKDKDVLGWARSVTARRLELPPDVRDELLILVDEVRGK